MKIRPNLDPELLRRVMEQTGETDKSKAVTRVLEWYVNGQKLEELPGFGKTSEAPP